MLLGLVLFEGALQLAAFGTFLLHGHSRNGAGPDPHSILCVGDSYTYGFGATSARYSYPAQLEGLLKRSGRGWRVLNGGLPGRNSHDLVLHLRSQLSESRPAIVYVMVGANDGWSRPSRATPAEVAHEGTAAFPWRWRTARLLALAHQALLGPSMVVPTGGPSLPSSPAAVPPPAPSPVGEVRPELVGSWNYQGVTVKLEADGRLSYCGTALAWSVQGDEIVLVGPSPDTVQRIRWNLRDGALHVSGGSLGKDAVLLPGAASPELACDGVPEEQAAWTAFQEGDLKKAEEAFQGTLASRAAQGIKENPFAHAGLARVYARTGRREQAVAELALLERDYENGGRTEAAGQLLVSVAEELAETRTVLRVAREMLTRHPENPWLWKAMAWQTFQDGDLATAETAVDKAVRYAAQDAQAKAIFLQLRSIIVAGRSPKAAIGSAISAFLLDGNEAVLVDQLVRIGQPTADVLVDQLLEELAVKSNDRIRINRIHQKAFDPDTAEAMRTLAWNLAQAVTQIRAAGAEPVLVSYPFRSLVAPVLRSVAQQTKAGWVEVGAEFERRLAAGGRREDFFVPDGHLNDAGYLLLAEVVAADALRRTQAR